MRLAAALAWLLLAGCGDAPPPPSQVAPVSAVMAAASPQGHARALAPRPFRFPDDHGPHPQFRTEWWYFTGNLRDAHGRPFGFQFTLFRFALAPAAPGDAARASAFATRQAWMAHFAISDVAAGSFHPFERFARGAAGLAGARASPLALWLEDWRADALVPDAPFPLRLRARDGEVALDLVLGPGRGPVTHGERGLSRKSAQPGNASYYYSYTRLPAAGVVRTPAGRFAVSGEAWMDREWGTSALGDDQTGWDWFALHLDDGRDLMFYRLRARGGGMHPFSAGTVVGPRGVLARLRARDVELRPLRHWRGPRGSRYPVAWRLRAGGLDLEVRAMLDDQEHRGLFRYWEGPVTVRGHDAGRPVGGRGYLEMTAD